MDILRSSTTGYKLKLVGWITLGWTLVGMMDSLFIKLTVTNSEYIVATDKYNFLPNLITNGGAGFVAGITVGTFIVFFLRDANREFAFGTTIIINSLILLGLIYFIGFFANSFYVSWESGLGLFDEMVLDLTLDRISSPWFIKVILLWYIVVMLTLAILNINEKYGPGVIKQLILGKYHRAREEERIFMFLDMNSSTAIAEKIGHEKYYNLLNDVYAQITDPIIATSGEIYQYVGDEVVISWPLKNGLLNANCLNCYFGIVEVISGKAAKYIQKYNLQPVFKAGLHCGKVTTGEVGVIKKDLVFTGDVLNTTARIRTKCTEYGVNLLLSDELLHSLKLPPHLFKAIKIGTIDLRGKVKKVVLFTLEGAMRY